MHCRRLQLNVAYYLPSIPLLIVSAFLDKPLEERLGGCPLGPCLAPLSALHRPACTLAHAALQLHDPPASPLCAGVARTILVRLLVGLVGYGAVTAWLPFMPPSIWVLLSAVVALGLFSGIAFSAAYQLVSSV